MSVEENKAVLKRIYDEVWNKRNLSLIPDLVSTDFVYANDRGHQGYRDVLNRTFSAFPDWHYTLEEVIGEGDRLAGRLTATGTMKGKWRGFEPTGKTMTWTFAVFWRFANGRVAESVGHADNLTVYRQLGISIPAQ
jgi:predicted ester cyclase